MKTRLHCLVVKALYGLALQILCQVPNQWSILQAFLEVHITVLTPSETECSLSTPSTAPGRFRVQLKPTL